MDRIENEYGKIFTSYNFYHHFYYKNKNKKLYINMLDTGNSIGEILFLFKKKMTAAQRKHFVASE